MLHVGVPTFLARLNRSLKRENQSPMSESSVRKLIAGKEYTVMTANRCCCATCRNYGSHAYERWREVLRSIAASTNRHLIRLIALVTEEERFRSSEVLTHYEDDASCTVHCRRHALSSYNDNDFRSDCCHPRADGALVQTPRTMAEKLGREPRSNDWNSTCDVCAADGSKSRLLVCEGCARACHKDCITVVHGPIYLAPITHVGDVGNV